MKLKHVCPFVLSVFLFFSLSLFAQTPYQEFKAQVNHIFEHVDKSKISSGLLLDYAMELIDVESFNGIPSDSNYVDSETFLTLYNSIYDAKVNDNINFLSSPGTISGNFGKIYQKCMEDPNLAVPIYMMHYEYDKMNEDAYEKGYVNVVNDQIREIKGYPYHKKQLFAATPAKSVFPLGVTEFYVNALDILTNTRKNLRLVEVSVKNSIAPASCPILVPNFRISINFTTPGINTLSIRLTYTDGTSYTSRTNVWVEPKGPSLVKEDKTDERVKIAKTSNHSGAVLEIKYAKNNTSKKIKKPLIIAAPFSVSNIMKKIPEFNLSEMLEEDKLKQIIDNFGSFIDYDFIFVKYNDGLDDIFRNAALFQEVIRYVNNQKDKTENNPNIVLGMSMGGLVARYALRSMELNNEDHQTWKYISLDAPHKGLNFPVGMQAMIKHLVDFDLQILGITVSRIIEKDSDMAALKKVLNSKALRQMLIYYCNDDIKLDNTMHESFQKEYDRIGFPQKCQNVAISNGTLHKAFDLSGGAKIFDYKIDDKDETNKFSIFNLIFLFSNHRAFLANYIPGKSRIRGELNVYSVTQNKQNVIYDGKIYLKKKFLGFIPVNIDISSKKLSSTNSMIALDGAIGSHSNLVSETMKNIKDELEDVYVYEKEFCFIPTASALAIKDWEKYAKTPLSNKDLFVEGLTDFEETVVNTTNLEHSSFQDPAVKNLVKQLVTAPIQIDHEGGSFRFDTEMKVNNPKNTKVTWSTSNPKLGIGKPTNTSGQVVAYEAGVEGVVTASVEMNAVIASLLGTTDKKALYRRRVKSTSAPSLTGVFDRNGRGRFHLTAHASSIPIKWTLSDNTNFRILKSSPDSVVIQALRYEDPLTLTATLTAGKEYKFTSTIQSPKLGIYWRGGNYPLNKEVYDKREIYLETTTRENYEYVKWSISEKYFEAKTSLNQPKIELIPLQNTEVADIIVETKVKGKVYKYRMQAAIRVPEAISLRTQKRWGELNVEKVLVVADIEPFNLTEGTFTWSGIDCTVKQCVLDRYSTDIFQLDLNEEYRGEVDNAVIPSEIYEEIMNSRDKDQIQLNIASLVVEDEKINSMMIEVSDRNNQYSSPVEREYFTIVSSSDFVDDLPPLIDIPLNNPRCAVVSINRNKTGQVTCTYSTSYGVEMSANILVPHTIYIPHASPTYNCHYNVSMNAIDIVKEVIDVDSDFISEEKEYKAYIYNELGIIKEVSFNSLEDRISIPLQNNRMSNYYVNVRNENGMMIVNQVIPAR